MLRHYAAIGLLFLALLPACSPSGEPAPLPTEPGAVAGRPMSIPTGMPAEIAAATPTVVPTLTSVPAGVESTPVEPDIPVVVDELYFGIPAGNGSQPYHVAVDSRRGRVYTLNYGVSSLKEGNTLSVLDLEKGEIIALIRLDNFVEDGFSPPDPLDLQVDPYRPRLYAVCGDRYADTPDSSLTIIDTEDLSILSTLSGVEAIAPGPDRLYLANDTRLWTVDPDSLQELESRAIEPRKYNEPLLLDPQADRLYMGRGYGWSLEVFDGGSLRPVGSYAVPDQLMGAAVDVQGGRLFILESDGEQVILRALDANGSPLVDPAPALLPDPAYSDLPLAFDGQTLYVAGGDYNAYQLRAFDLPDLMPLDSLPLPNKPYDLAVDSTSGLLYAAFNWPSSVVLTIDPDIGQVDSVYTARVILDATVDPEAGRLYVLDDAGTLHALDLTDYSLLGRLDTGFSLMRGVPFSYQYGRLSLDPGRNRLYISGDPVWVVDTDTLQVVTDLDGRGQVTPDPTGDRIYLTPPCSCRIEQCNTLILSADTLTGTERLFPAEDPFTAPCVVGTQLDAENQLLYARIYNGVAGSNSGDYYTVFDVSGEPQEIYTTFAISYGDVAFDSPNQRAFMPRYRLDRSFIHRFQAEGGTITQTLELAGAQGQLAYDSLFDRLYAVGYERSLQVFDGDLTLFSEITLPGQYDLLAFDPRGQRLYLLGPNAEVLVVATSGGQLEPPPPAIPTTDRPLTQQLLTAPDGRLFRVYDWRLYRSDDDGGTWTLLGRGLPGRRVGDLAISPDYERDQTLFVGLWLMGRNGGLYRSTDGGETWLPTTRGLGDMEISEIRFSPTFARDRTIFLSTFGRGLYRSSDGGETWDSLAHTYTSDPYELDVDHMALSPTFADDGLILISRRSLLRSSDGGDTWVDTGVPPGIIAFSPDFARDGLILSEGRWRSTDRGQSWQPAAVGLEAIEFGAEAMFFSPGFAADQTVYVLLFKDYDAPLVLQRSRDAGRTWESLLGGLPAGFEMASATMSPTGELHLSTLDGRQHTTPGEDLEWGRLPADVLQVELQDMAITSDGVIFVANSDAGVFKSADGGASWVETGFPARAHAISHPAQLALAQDGTLFAATGTVVMHSRDEGESWSPAALPSGFQVVSLAVSPNFATDRTLVVGGNYANRQILRSTDGGNSWQLVFDAETVDGASDVSRIVFSPNYASDGTLYAWLQYGGLLYSTDGGLNWSLVDSEQSGYYGQTLALSPAGDRLYLGALDGHVLVSEDAGEHWIDVGEGIPDERVWSSALAFGPDGALFMGTDVGVYRSSDGGQTWARASAGLPYRPGENMLQSVRALGFDGGRLYAALTWGGVFVSEDMGGSWRSTTTGEPASPIQVPPTSTPMAPPPPVSVTPSLPAVEADCPLPPENFAELWRERVALLGCPVASTRLPMVEQAFQGGWMFWRSDAAVIYVVPSNQPYAWFEDTWNESQPAYSCSDLYPSQTPPTPQRGFGKVWCDQPLLRKLLGDATGQERLFDATLQEFAAGLMFQTDDGVTYILESRLNGWERVE